MVGRHPCNSQPFKYRVFIASHLLTRPCVGRVEDITSEFHFLNFQNCVGEKFLKYSFCNGLTGKGQFLTYFTLYKDELNFE